MPTALENYLDTVVRALHRAAPASKSGSAFESAAPHAVAGDAVAPGASRGLSKPKPSRLTNNAAVGLPFYARSAQSRRWYFIDRVFPGLRAGLTPPEREHLEAKVRGLPSGSSPVWSENTRVVCVAVAELAQAGVLPVAVLEWVHHAWRRFVTGQGLAREETALAAVGFGWQQPDPAWLEGVLDSVPRAGLRASLAELETPVTPPTAPPVSGETGRDVVGNAVSAGIGRARVSSGEPACVRLKLNPSVRLAAYSHDVRAELRQGQLPLLPTFIAYLLCRRTCRPRALSLSPTRMAWIKALSASLTFGDLKTETGMPAAALEQALATEVRSGLLVMDHIEGE